MAIDLTSETTAEQVFRLLDLPPELWSRVCYLAVKSNTTIQYDVSQSTRPRQSSVEQPAIIRTCRALRAEALPMFYTSNDFVIHDDYGPYAFTRFQPWIDGIGSRNRALIKSFTIYFSTEEDVEEVKLDEHWATEQKISSAWGLSLGKAIFQAGQLYKEAGIFARN